MVRILPEGGNVGAAVVAIIAGFGVSLAVEGPITPLITAGSIFAWDVAWRALFFWYYSG